MDDINFNYETELSKCRTMEDITGANGLVQKMIKNAMENIMQKELSRHLQSDNLTLGNNYRNGTRSKKVKTEYGNIEVNTPRDRNGTFEPELLGKRQTIADGIKSQIVSMYGKGMSTRDISDHIEGLYGTELSATSISNITDEVMVEGKEWFTRSLDSIYPVVFLDAVHFKVKEDNRIISKAAYVALGLTLEGKKEVMGVWIGENEGAKFWLKVCTELKNRGVNDILIACIDGLKGFPEAIQTVFPETKIQLCIIHQIRNSMKYVASKDQKEFMKDLKNVYKAPTQESALNELNELYGKWGKKYSMVLDSWLTKWDNLSTYFHYEDRIRKLIYTTNTLEGFNRQLRKVTKTKSVFPNDEALLKSIYLAINDITKKWTTVYHDWGQTLAQFKINFEDRIALDI